MTYRIITASNVAARRVASSQHISQATKEVVKKLLLERLSVQGICRVVLCQNPIVLVQPAADSINSSLASIPALVLTVIYVARSELYLPPSSPFLNNLWPQLATPARSLISMEMRSCLSSRARVPAYAARLSYR